MKHYGRIIVILNKKIIYRVKYQYDVDMYLNSIRKFFYKYSEPEIKNFFSMIKPVTIKAYDQMVKECGFYEEYNYDLHRFNTVEANDEFLRRHQELDSRNFINPFTGYNDFDVMIDTNRIYTLAIDKSKDAVDFEYTINLDTWSLKVTTAYYGDFQEELKTTYRSSSNNN